MPAPTNVAELAAAVSRQVAHGVVQCMYYYRASGRAVASGCRGRSGWGWPATSATPAACSSSATEGATSCTSSASSADRSPRSVAGFVRNAGILRPDVSGGNAHDGLSDITLERLTGNGRAHGLALDSVTLEQGRWDGRFTGDSTHPDASRRPGRPTPASTVDPALAPAHRRKSH